MSKQEDETKGTVCETQPKTVGRQSRPVLPAELVRVAPCDKAWEKKFAIVSELYQTEVWRRDEALAECIVRGLPGLPLTVVVPPLYVVALGGKAFGCCGTRALVRIVKTLLRRWTAEVKMWPREASDAACGRLVELQDEARDTLLRDARAALELGESAAAGEAAASAVVLHERRLVDMHVAALWSVAAGACGAPEEERAAACACTVHRCVGDAIGRWDSPYLGPLEGQRDADVRKALAASNRDLLTMDQILASCGFLASAWATAARAEDDRKGRLVRTFERDALAYCVLLVASESFVDAPPRRIVPDGVPACERRPAHANLGNYAALLAGMAKWATKETDTEKTGGRS